MAKIEKEALRFPVIHHLVAREFTKDGSTLPLTSCIYIVQLYKEDGTVLWIFWVVGPYLSPVPSK